MPVVTELQPIIAGMEPHMETAQFARELGISPNTLLKAHSRDGHYFGATPVKAANGRLIWPASELPRLKGGAA